ncbi:MAG: Fic/DOC family N-terminal domain-containing protein [Myxococcota bacterium]|jgi:hypothetical protein|nr:Fic/DOC family N-terminal domain-containing protein [Myxococcota bacterium]
MTRTTGIYERSTVAGESVEAFIPLPLPPTEPPLDLSGHLAPLLARANESIRLLELAGGLVPSIEWFVYAFVRKEAVLSAQIEGTQATLMDLLEVEASGEAPVDADVEEVCGYVDALNFAWDHLGRADGLPLSMRLLSETHARLLRGARGAQKQPSLTVNRVIELLDCSRKAVRVLEAAGIERPLERKKNRTVVFEDYLAHLRTGTELSA